MSIIPEYGASPEVQKEVDELREQVKLLRGACELAKECLDNNGFGKAYVQSELYKALEQTNPKPSGRSSEGKSDA